MSFFFLPVKSYGIGTGQVVKFRLKAPFKFPTVTGAFLWKWAVHLTAANEKLSEKKLSVQNHCPVNNNEKKNQFIIVVNAYRMKYQTAFLSAKQFFLFALI